MRNHGDNNGQLADMGTNLMSYVLNMASKNRSRKKELLELLIRWGD